MFSGQNDKRTVNVFIYETKFLIVEYIDIFREDGFYEQSITSKMSGFRS